jgi:Putative type VII ESX secretion system translocon, EccE
MTERLFYRFGPLERHGILGPIRAGQAGLIAASLVVALLALDNLPNAVGAFLGLATVALATALTTVPAAGRTAEQWLPVLTGFMLRGIVGGRTYRSELPTAGIRVGGRRESARELRRPAVGLPPALRGVEVRGTDRDGIGILRESRGRRLTAVLACRALAFTLLDAEAQERRLAQWGLVLSGAAQGPIRRLQWIERTAPAQGDELARWLHSARDPSLPARGAPIVESYLELISASSTVTNDHEVLLAIQVDATQLRGRREQNLESVLVEQTARIARGLEAAEIKVLGALGAGQLARALRTAFDPYSRAELGALDAVGRGGGDLAPAAAGPLGAREHWDRYRCDGACHATYWISGWPRVDVSPMFMDALLGSSDTVRTVAVAFEPVSPDRSTREVEAAITRDRADSELRRRFGQSETARQRQAQDSAIRREAELAAGHGEVRLAGFVTVSGRDEQELERACAEIHQHAARARLEVHRMYGQQADAFTFTLPLARGLR